MNKPVDLAAHATGRIYGTLFFSLLATITGVGIVVPLLPVYASGLGASGFTIGMIFGAFSLSRSFLLPYFGRLSDVKGRKPFLVIGLLAYGLVSVAFILSSTLNELIAIRFIQGAASAMVMPVAQAYIGDIAPVGKEGRYMGLFNVSLFCGLSLGPVLGGMINDHFSLNAAFAAMGFLAMAGCVLNFLLLPPVAREIGKRRRQNSWSWRQIIGDRIIAGICIYRFMYTACIGVIWSFLPVLADSRFHLTSSRIGVLVMLGVFVSGLIQAPMGYLADRINRKGLMVTGGLVVVLAVALYAWADRYQTLFWASTLFGIGGGAAMPALMAMATTKGRQAEAMGSVMAVLTVAHSLGMLSGALMAGLMMDWFNLGYAFVLGSVFMAVGIVAFVLLTGREQVPPDPLPLLDG